MALSFFLLSFLDQLPLLTLNGPLLHVLFPRDDGKDLVVGITFHTSMEEICRLSPAVINHLISVGPLKGRPETCTFKLVSVCMATTVTALIVMSSSKQTAHSFESTTLAGFLRWNHDCFYFGNYLFCFKCSCYCLFSNVRLNFFRFRQSIYVRGVQ